MTVFVHIYQNRRQLKLKGPARVREIAIIDGSRRHGQSVPVVVVKATPRVKFIVPMADKKIIPSAILRKNPWRVNNVKVKSNVGIVWGNGRLWVSLTNLMFQCSFFSKFACKTWISSFESKFLFSVLVLDTLKDALSAMMCRQTLLPMDALKKLVPCKDNAVTHRQIVHAKLYNKLDYERMVNKFWTSEGDKWAFIVTTWIQQNLWNSLLFKQVRVFISSFDFFLIPCLS